MSDNSVAKKSDPVSRREMKKRKDGVSHVRFIAATGMLSAVAFVLMYIEIALPFIPAFIKFDFSDLPALIGAFAYGPLCGVCICFIKNLLHLAFSSSMLVGELSNFILGAVFAAFAGTVYKHKKTKKRAMAGGVFGALAMGLFSIFSNYLVVYPVYYRLVMPQEAIIGMYQAILPSVETIMQCLLVFNLPFTLAKGLIDTVICMLIYKPLSPLLHGNR